MSTNGSTLNLLAQLNKLTRHNRQGSFKTRERYEESMKRFCRFLAEQYHLEKLENIAPKHILAYVLHMQHKNLSPATIKTELAAIRFWHDKLPRPRFKLPDNAGMHLERRSFGKVDRTWSADEFDRFIALYLQQFILRHRPEFQSGAREYPLHMHGLRHTYAQAQYVDLVAAGHTQIAAELHVSKLLGHTRPEVTRIYLAGAQEE